jgi:stage V sporulation protein AD
MAPAAIDTLTRYFSESRHSPDDFDLIATGDLGYEGYKIVWDFMKDKGFTKNTRYHDCGLMIFDREGQDVHAGGSGCGCSASVLASHILPEIQKGKLKHVLLIGTGALMSPASVQQGLSIPGIGHLIHLEGGI